jgi:hypothetical protein
VPNSLKLVEIVDEEDNWIPGIDMETSRFSLMSYVKQVEHVRPPTSDELREIRMREIDR